MKVRDAALVPFSLALSGPQTPLVLTHGADDGQAALDATAPLNLVPWPPQAKR